MSNALKICIGDVNISIKGEVQGGNWETTYRPFIGHGKTDICLRLHHGFPRTPIGEKVFDCPPIWTMYRLNGETAIRIYDGIRGLGRTLVLRQDLKTTDLYFAQESSPSNHPFYGPTMELLMVNYLAQGRGIIIHACGIAKDGKGALFVGESGAGKSTLARMWGKRKNVEVLSDDRILIRKRGHRFWMYGTPWHGDAKCAFPAKAALERILFLKHGERNSLKRIEGADPVSRHLTCSFPPYWDPQGMEFALDLFSDLSSEVPCQEFTFKPDRSALDFIEQITR